MASASASLLWSGPRPHSSNGHCPRDYNLGVGLVVGFGLGFGLGRVQPAYGTSMAMYTVCKDSLVHGTRLCTRAVHCHVHVYGL